MSKKDILSYIINNNLTISSMQMVICILVALVAGICIYFVYRMTYTGTAYSKNFAQSLVFVTIITAIIMMTIQSNLALSLGMVGSLSIIRFRSAIKEPRDMVFIFWSVAAGVACGAAIFVPAILGSVVIAVIAFIFSKGIYDNTNYLLITEFEVGVEDAEKKLVKAIKKNTKKYTSKMTNISEDKEEYVYELYITKNSNVELVDTIKAIEGVKKVNIVSYNGEMLS